MSKPGNCPQCGGTGNVQLPEGDRVCGTCEGDGVFVPPDDFHGALYWVLREAQYRIAGTTNPRFAGLRAALDHYRKTTER